MYSWEKSLKRDRFQQERKNPSFSSTLLDKICHSIDESGVERGELNSYSETIKKKQSNGFVKGNRAKEEEEEMANLQRACLIEKWMEKKASEKAIARRRQSLPELDRKSQYDNDPLFFSTTSSSSDSSSGGFSSSETESFYAARTRTSCFAPSRPKPVRTSVSARSEKQERIEKPRKTEHPLFYEHSELHIYDDYHYNSVTDHGTKHEEGFIKSKSRALKIYSNLKKVKQPLSPGGRVATFLNSLFTAGNSKKTKNSTSSIGGLDDTSMERKSKSAQASICSSVSSFSRSCLSKNSPASREKASTCSSVSSFSRSCLSKNSPASREKLRNGVKRSVRFYPVSIIVDEDCRPCGHKSLHEEDSSPMTIPTSRKLINCPSRRNEQELKFQFKEKTRRVEEAAREILKGYHQNQKRNDLILSYLANNNEVEDEEEEEDDAASYSSSDLFELDHLAFIGNDRYCEELPVYETTHVDRNRAIANGLIL